MLLLRLNDILSLDLIWVLVNLVLVMKMMPFQDLIVIEIYVVGNFQKEDASEIINIQGRVGNNSTMNGMYKKQSTLHEGRVWYKKESSDWHIRW